MDPKESVMVSNVNERKKAEDALRESEEKCRSLVENVPDIIYTLDRNGNFTSLNEHGLTLLGYQKDELIGQHFMKVIHPDDIEMALELFKKAVSTKKQKPSGLMFRLLAKDGRTIWVSLNSSMTFDEKGRFFQEQGVARDITERKKMEEKLRLFSHSVNSSVDGIVIGNLEGRITYVNEAIVRMFGYSKEELIGKEIAFIYLEDQIPKLEEAIKVMVEGGWTGELVGKRKDGEHFPIAVSSSIVVDDEGRIIAYMASHQDITEREEMEREIRKFKTISDMASYGTAISDLEGTLLYVNEAFAQMHGYMPEELIGKNLSILHTEEQIRNVMGLNEYLKKEGSYTAEEVWHKRKDYTVFPTLMSATLIKDENGTPLFLSAIAVDITERKRAEERFSALYELSTKIDITTEELLDFTADEVAKMLSPDMCYITTLEGDNLLFRALRGDANGLIKKGMEIKVDETICGLVIDEKKPIVIPDIKKDPIAERYPYLEEYGIESYAGIPLLGRGRKAIGTICVLNKEPQDYSKEDMELLSIFASRVSLAIERARIEGKLLNAKAKLQERAEELQELTADLGESNVRLRESEERYRDLFENSREGIYTLDLNGNFTTGNRRMEEILGYVGEELLEKHFASLLREEDKPIISNILEVILRGEEAILELDLKTKDDKLAPVEIIMSPIKKQGKIVGVQGTARDIIERKITEEALKESEEKYRAIFESANDVIVTLDLKGNITAVNRRVEEVGGYNREELMGKNIARLKMFPPKSLAIILKNFGKRMIGMDVLPYEVKLIRKDGKRRFIEINAMPLKREGKIVGDLALLRDVTERKEAEENLREKMDELEKFNKMMIGRELRMVELKNKLKELEEKLNNR